jgi:hypothetical protein
LAAGVSSIGATTLIRPRSIREVLRIRQPSGLLRLRPHGPGSTGTRPAELHLKYGLVCTARFGKGRLGSAAHTATGSPVTTNCPKSTDIHSIPASKT